MSFYSRHWECKECKIKIWPGSSYPGICGDVTGRIVSLWGFPCCRCAKENHNWSGFDLFACTPCKTRQSKRIDPQIPHPSASTVEVLHSDYAKLSAHVYCSSEQSRKLKFEKEGFKILLDKISDPQPGAAADFSLSYVLAIKEERVQSSGTLVLVFRGTKTVTDLITDMHIESTSVEENGADGGAHYRVHAGYWTKIKEHCPPIFELLKHCSSQHPAISKLVCTGHSLGGAYALLTRLYMLPKVFQAANPNASLEEKVSALIPALKSIEVVTFGAPLVLSAPDGICDRAKSIPQEMLNGLCSYVYLDDLVPRLLGSKHRYGKPDPDAWKPFFHIALADTNGRALYTGGLGMATAAAGAVACCVATGGLATVGFAAGAYALGTQVQDNRQQFSKVSGEESALEDVSSRAKALGLNLLLEDLSAVVRSKVAQCYVPVGKYRFIRSNSSITAYPQSRPTLHVVDLRDEAAQDHLQVPAVPFADSVSHHHISHYVQAVSSASSTTRLATCKRSTTWFTEPRAARRGAWPVSEPGAGRAHASRAASVVVRGILPSLGGRAHCSWAESVLGCCLAGSRSVVVTVRPRAAWLGQVGRSLVAQATRVCAPSPCFTFFFLFMFAQKGAAGPSPSYRPQLVESSFFSPSRPRSADSACMARPCRLKLSRPAIAADCHMDGPRAERAVTHTHTHTHTQTNAGLRR